MMMLGRRQRARMQRISIFNTRRMRRKQQWDRLRDGCLTLLSVNVASWLTVKERIRKWDSDFIAIQEPRLDLRGQVKGGGLSTKTKHSYSVTLSRLFFS